LIWEGDKVEAVPLLNIQERCPTFLGENHELMFRFQAGQRANQSNDVIASPHRARRQSGGVYADAHGINRAILGEKVNS